MTSTLSSRRSRISEARSRALLLLFLASLPFGALAGCARSKDGASTATARPSAAPPTSPPTPAAATLPPPGSSRIFGAKLAQEATGRPTSTPTAEGVLAAIAAAGVPLEEQAPHVASTIGAHFCIGARSASGLALSACEYDDDAKATAGRDLSAKAFATIAHRDVTLNKKTTLTILQTPYTPESQAAHDAAVAAFKKL